MLKLLLKSGMFILSVIALSFVLDSSSSAKEDMMPASDIKPRTIAVFKNGLGFFIREGEVTLKDGTAVMENVPKSTLGSLWIGSQEKETVLEEVIGIKEEVEKNIEAISIEELLKANIGKEAVITYGDKTIKGKIKSVPENREIEKTDAARPAYSGYYTASYLQPQQAAIVIVDTEEGKVALNKSGISRVEFQKDFNPELKGKEKTKRLKIRISSQREKTKLTMSYLQKGISWMPGYLINIADPEKARITMNAVIINDTENFENADVYFVVGYPNFIYADVLSPMAMEESIAQFIGSLTADRRDNDRTLSNIMRQSVVGYGEETTPRPDFGYAAIKGLPGASEEDLFLYHKKGITLNKGERAYYNIFSYEVEYRHIYEWAVPDTINLDPRGYQQQETEKKEKTTEQVWHSIKLANSTPYPWTTAPAFVVSGWKPLSQEVVSYTPKGAKTNLKLTVATDIQTTRHEYELERQRDVQIYHRTFDLVTIEGKLSIKNNKTSDVTMEIKKKLTGEVLEAGHQGKVEKIAEGLKGVNHNSVISWEIPAKAGEEIKLTYKYKVYIAH